MRHEIFEKMQEERIVCVIHFFSMFERLMCVCVCKKERERERERENLESSQKRKKKKFAKRHSTISNQSLQADEHFNYYHLFYLAFNTVNDSILK